MILPVLPALLRLPLFKLLDPSWLAGWAQRGESSAVDLGHRVLQAGATTDWLYVVREGRLRVLRPLRTGGEASLGSILPGQVVGDYSLLPPGNSPASCVAAEPTRLVRLPLSPLRKHLASQPRIWAKARSWIRLHFLVRHLRAEAFLGFMSASSFLPLLESCETLAVPAGHCLQARQLATDRWFFLQSGQAENRRDGRAAPLGPGYSFGEPAFLGRTDLDAVVTTTPVTCLCLPQGSLVAPEATDQDSNIQTMLAATKPSQRHHAWIRQREETDCAVAALAMVALTLGLEVTLEQVRQRFSLGRDGATASQLQTVAAGLGLHCTPARVAPTQLSMVACPAIAHCADGHYVVVYACDGELLSVADPAQGVLALSRTEFLQRWSGILLLCARK